MGTTVVQDSVLALTDQVILPVSVVYNAIKEIKKEPNEQFDPLVVTQAASLGALPVDSSSVDVLVCICKSFDFLGEKILGELSRVLKPGGQILFQTPQSATEQATTSSLQGKLLVAGFVDLKTGSSTSALLSEFPESLTIRAKKPSWKVGSSFSIKKVTRGLPKVQIDDDMDLIDEDSLLSEEDLKKPQIPSVGDCEVSSTKKACKNCTCGRAEAEEKVQKIGPTMDQLNNPQSACGSCGLGDAFRCGTCPYKGLPPFKLGEKEEHVTSITEDYETTCWGCGLHLTVSPYEPTFICGWCGAITNRNASKLDNKYLRWRRVRDRCFVCLLSIFMLFMICAGVWAIYPVAFSISYVCGAFHCSISIILSVATISTYCLAAFSSPGAPPLILWGSFSVVGRGGLENYTYCLYCRKPKSPRSHHCRSCQMCVLDMDHHCPFYSRFGHQ